jgi:hypothetical protein
VLVSSKVKGTEILERAPLDKIGVLVYNHKRSTFGSILKAMQKKLLTRDGTQRVDSIAFVVPCKAGKVSICSGCSFTHDNMLDGDTCAFLDGLTHLINHDVNVYINGSRMDFLLLDDTIPESAELAMEIKAHCNLQTVTSPRRSSRWPSPRWAPAPWRCTSTSRNSGTGPSCPTSLFITPYRRGRRLTTSPR